VVVVNTHSSGSSVTIQSQFPAASQALALSFNPAQNVLVDGVSPKQHPSPYVGAGGAVVVVNRHASGSSVTINSQLAAASHALWFSSIPAQKEFVDGVAP